MEIAFISPIDDLGYDYTNYHMALTHLVLKYPDYADHYKKLAENGSFVMLDNSLIELGEAASLEKVLEAAAIINPSEIVLPDVYKKGDDTVNAVDNALIKLRHLAEKNGLENYDFQLQAVCHGETEEKWKETWHRLQQYGEIGTIAIPKVTEHQFGSRTPFVKWALENNEDEKEIHLLGCALPQEFTYYKKLMDLGIIESLDTSNPIIHGLKGIRYKHYGLKEKDPTKIDQLEEVELTSDVLYNINYNLIKFKQFLK